MKGGIVVCSFHVAHLVANNKGSTSSATAVMGHSALRFFRDTSALDQKKKINDLYDELRPSLLAYLCGLGLAFRSMTQTTLFRNRFCG